MHFLFGPFELDAGSYKLRRDGQEVPLQPKVFDAIRYLVERNDRVVPKEELLDALWPGEHVNDTAVPWTISRARKALGQAADAKEPIETVRGRGYRFVGQVQHVAAGSAAPSSSTVLLCQPPDSVPTKTQPDPFVGRAEPMQRLLGALQAAGFGRGRLCLVTGEAGIGKTRCIAEFAAVARRLEWSVWTGRCLEGGRSAGFWPWVQVLRDVLAEGELTAERSTETRALLEEIIPRPDVTDRAIDEDGTSAFAARFWLLEKISRHIFQCAESTPRLVILEDVHWADEASLDLLAFLAAELSHSAVLVVATARSASERGTESWDKIQSRLGAGERVELTALNAKDVEDYVAEVIGLEFPAEIHRTVYAKCGGNPLFLQESVRLLAARTAGSSALGAQGVSSEDIPVPRVARDLLRARLTGLGPETVKVLEVACVIGQDFELPVLQGALDIAAERLLVTLDEATRARLIAPRPRAGAYAFVHDTIREALYEEISTARRVELHLGVAEAIEARSAGDYRVNDLAYHFYRALPRGDVARVLRYARAAGDAAMRGFSYADAARFFGWAIDAQRFQQGVDPRNRCELLLALAAALRFSGRLRESRQPLYRAIELARSNSLADLLWEAARGLRPTVRFAPLPDEVALNALEDAWKLSTDDQLSLRVRVLAQLACIPPHSLSTDESHRLSSRAVELARQSGNSADLTQALTSRLHVLSGPDHIEELLEVTAEIATRDPRAAVEVESARYHALLYKGDLAGAEASLENTGRLARLLRRTESFWQYQRTAALGALHAGDFAAADASFHEVFLQSQRLRLRYGTAYYMMHAAVMAYERTGFGALSSVGWRGELEWAAAVPSFQAHWLRLLVETGRADEARRGLETFAAQRFATVTKDLGYLNALAHLSIVAITLEERVHAETLYALLAPYPHHNTPNAFGYYQGSVSYFLGQLARFLGSTDDAERHFMDALAMNERLRFAPQVGRTQAALACTLLDRGRRADVARARALLASAGDIARRLGMAPLAIDVRRALERTNAQAARSSSRAGT